MMAEVEVKIINYDLVGYKPAESLARGAAVELRRLTEYATRGETVTMVDSEAERLKALDPPAVGDSESQETRPAIVITKPDQNPASEPTDPDPHDGAAVRETPAEADRAALEAAAGVLASAGIEVELPEVQVEGVDTPPASGDELDGEAAALYEAGTVATLTKLAEKTDGVEVETGDRKADIARKLAAAGVTASDLPS